VTVIDVSAAMIASQVTIEDARPVVFEFDVE
jgi:hypothetical protein